MPKRRDTWNLGLGLAIAVTLSACDRHPPTYPGADLVAKVSPPAAGMAVTMVTPRFGLTAGGTPVTIVGKGFQEGASVKFGDIAVDATVGSTNIVFETPPHAPGLVNVFVTNRDGQKAGLVGVYTYMEPSPSAVSVTSISPAVGSVEGGASVVIAGTGFTQYASVTFGGAPGHLGVLTTAFLYDGSLYVQTPPHAAGQVDVVVTNPDGLSGTLPNGYSYVAPGTFDFNGEWEGGTGYDWQTPVRFTIRDNVLVSFRCGDTQVSLPSSQTVVSNGAFSIVEASATTLTGRIVTDTYATGRVSASLCASGNWIRGYLTDTYAVYRPGTPLVESRRGRDR